MDEGKGEIRQQPPKGLNPEASKKIWKQLEDGNPEISWGGHVIKAADKSLEEREKLKKAASIDVLTGLYSQNAWKIFKEDSKNYKGKKTIIFLDINGLKDINDKTKDHAIGDDLIIRTASYLKTIFSRDTDSIYRAGGDEFAIVANYVSPEEREKFFSYINQSFDHKELDAKSLDFSFGVAFTDQEESLEDTIKRADATMYQNKNDWKANNPERYQSRQ